MIEMEARYSPIDDEVDEVVGACQGPITVKVLRQEKSALVSGLSQNSTIADLKREVQKAHGIPTSQQRLIFNGKALAPDDKLLSHFNIKDQSVVHLFPRPNTPAAVAAAAAAEEQLTFSARHLGQYDRPDPFITSHLPIHFDDSVGQSIREVKMWCYILVVVSAMTLFNNFSYMGATGKQNKIAQEI
jgi:hypothetical protein